MNLTQQADGTRKGSVEFTAVVFDAEGKRLNLTEKEFGITVRPERYRQFMATPLRCQLLVSAPVKGESFMRLIIRDAPSNRYGVVEIPTAKIGQLPPLEAQSVPTGEAKPNTAGAPVQPATKQ